MISIDSIKELRNLTSAGYMACKNALFEADGNIEKAIKHLREIGVTIANKKSIRTASEGIIGSYTHTNEKICVMIEICCETDFATKTVIFKKCAKDIAMHIAAMSPKYIKIQDIPENIIISERQIYKNQLKNENKRADIIDRIVDGRIAKYYCRVCLYNQPYYRDEQHTLKDILNECIAKLGENIEVKRFIRYEVGINE